MTRSDARELALHLVYSRSFTQEAPEELLARRLESSAELSQDVPLYADRPSKAQQAYVRAVVSGVAEREGELDGIIARYSIGWDVSRISRLTRATLQIAIFEILYVADVPTGAAISEAVRLAKRYDGDDTGAFVNGILGSFARSLTAEEVK